VAKGLSRELILDTALGLVDASGIEGLTMRSLGEALGVQAMSLYRYVANKDALLDALQEAVVARMQPLSSSSSSSNSSSSSSWRVALEASARSLREVLRAHPRAIPLFFRPAAGERAFAAIVEVTDVLMDEGFDDADALRAFQALLAFVVGQAMWQFGASGERPVDDEFEFGLRAMLDGFELHLVRARAET
jgi:AcrR family transcriptional regulator